MSSNYMGNISAFLDAAEAGSFSAAALRTGRSKSGTAKAVGRLEEHLGVRLFQRTTRQFTLTKEGKVFYDSCQRAAKEIDEGVQHVNALQGEPSGSVSISLPVVFGTRWILPILLKIAKQFPQLNLEISFTDKRVDLVEQGIDLVVRIGMLKSSSSIMSRSLGIQDSMMCASPAYLRRNGVPRSLEDLHLHQCISFTGERGPISWCFSQPGDSHGKQICFTPRTRLSLNHSEGIVEATLQGLGISVLSSWLIAEHLRTGKLSRVLPEIQTSGFPIHLLWVKTKHQVPAVRHIIDALVDALYPQAPWERLGSLQPDRLDAASFGP